MKISTYRINKRGFDSALSCANSRYLFADSLLPLTPFSFFFFTILSRLHTHFFLLVLVPHQVSNQLPFAELSLTSLSSTPLHHEIQLRIIPPKVIFILLDYLAFPKICITIYLFMCLTHVARRTKTCIAFVGPW